ncbi:hypothetical protein EDD15DRAFT_2193043 [Pisolithus albus]|nr:hypothetical protein EDD15DRAFT_2193043 [Pisolithus albus]
MYFPQKWIQHRPSVACMEELCWGVRLSRWNSFRNVFPPGNGYRTNLLWLAWKSCVGGFGWAGLLPMGNYNTYDITACHSTMDFPRKIHAAQTQYGSIPAEVRLLRKCCLGGFGSAGIVDMGNYNVYLGSGTHSEMYFPRNMDAAPTHCGLCGRAASGGSAWRVEWVQKMDTAQTWYGSIPAAVRLVWKSCLGWFGLAGLVAMGTYNVYLGSGTHSEMYYPREMDTAQTRCGLCERAAAGGSAWQKMHAAQAWYGSIPAEVRLLRKCCLGGFGLAGIVDIGNYNKMHAAQTRYGSIPAEVWLVWKRCLGWLGSAGLVAMGNYALVQLVRKSCLGGFDSVALVPMGNYNTYDISKMHAAHAQYGSIPAEVRLLRKSCLGGFGLAGGTHPTIYFPWPLLISPAGLHMGCAASAGIAGRPAHELHGISSLPDMWDGPTHELRGLCSYHRPAHTWVVRHQWVLQAGPPMSCVSLPDMWDGPAHELCGLCSYHRLARTWVARHQRVLQAGPPMSCMASAACTWVARHQRVLQAGPPMSCVSLPDMWDGPAHELCGLCSYHRPARTWVVRHQRVLQAGPPMSCVSLPDMWDGPAHELCGLCSYHRLARTWVARHQRVLQAGPPMSCVSLPDMWDGPAHESHGLRSYHWLARAWVARHQLVLQTGPPTSCAASADITELARL